MIDILALMVIVVILSLVVYHISQYCTKETPFEQALAEQRQKMELETYPISSKSEKNHKKNKQIKKIKPKKDDNEASAVKEGLAHSVKNQTKVFQANKKVQQEISKTNKNKLSEDTKITPILSDNQDIKKDIKKKKDVIKEEKYETTNLKLEDASDKRAKQIVQQSKGTNAIPLSVKASLVGQPAACKVDVEKNNKIAGKDSTTRQPSSKGIKNAANGKGTAKLNVPILTETKDFGKIKPKVKEAPVVALPIAPAVKENISLIKHSKKTPSTATKCDSHEPLSKKIDQPEDTTVCGKSLVIVSNAVKVKSKAPKESEVVMEQLEVIVSQIQNAEKKKKKEKPEEKKVKLNVAPDDALTRLLPIINKTHLSGAEIQMLIESLLNKQQLTGNQGGDWVEKGRIDPIKEFKRQLEEVESKLKDQSETNKALSTKIIDMRTELNSERIRSSNYRKQLESSESGYQIKLESTANMYRDNLNAKINECKIAIEKEFQTKFIQQQQSSKAEAELVEQLRSKLAEVEQQFQHEKLNFAEGIELQQQTQIALEETQQQLNQLLQDKNDFMENCQQYQQHVSVLEDRLVQQETAYNARMAELQLSLSASEETLSQTMKQLNHSLSEIDQLKVQQKNFENLRELQSQNLVKLKETQNEKNDLENRLLSSEKDLSKLKELINDQKTQIECLIEEKESLASQSIRPAAEGQENGDIHNDQKEQNISNVNEMYEEQISSLTKEVSKLKDEIIYQRIKNDEEGGKWERESILTRQVLLRLFPSVNVSENLDHSSFLKQIETAAVAAQTVAAAEIKPQIIEKLVEKIVQDPSLVKQLEEMKLQNEDLQKKIELQNEEKLSLESNKSFGEEQSLRITALEIENKSLEGRIAYYQDVLSNTETLLKTLESSVEKEETSWKEKLVQKEEVIQQLNADKINLTLRTSELQAALDKVQQAEEMESQMNALKDKLNKEEIEKTNLKEQLQIVQEQLKDSNLSQTLNSNGPANGLECPEVEGSTK